MPLLPKGCGSPSSTPSSTPDCSAPLLAADQPPAPPELRGALTTISRVMDDYITNAPLGVAA